jgi:flavin reductase (DIM6/NTAB) family NADH-FMN oxidoreductase RutF
MDPNLFYKISYGLYVICWTEDGKINGQIANTMFQISANPATIAIGINKK